MEREGRCQRPGQRRGQSSLPVPSLSLGGQWRLVALFPTKPLGATMSLESLHYSKTSLYSCVKTCEWVHVCVCVWCVCVHVHICVLCCVVSHTSSVRWLWNRRASLDCRVKGMKMCMNVCVCACCVCVCVSTRPEHIVCTRAINHHTPSPQSSAPVTCSSHTPRVVLSLAILQPNTGGTRVNPPPYTHTRTHTETH